VHLLKKIRLCSVEFCKLRKGFCFKTRPQGQRNQVIKLNVLKLCNYQDEGQIGVRPDGAALGVRLARLLDVHVQVGDGLRKLQGRVGQPS
jgi:hypothetical protein